MNEYLMEMELREKRRELLEEAARQRLLRLHDRAARPSMHHLVYHRLMAMAGNLLIDWGERLKNRAATLASIQLNKSCRNG